MVVVLGLKISCPVQKWDFSCQQRTAVGLLSRLLAQLQNHLTPRSSPTVSHAIQTSGKRLDGNTPREASALRLSLWDTFRNEASLSLTFRARVIHFTPCLKLLQEQRFNLRHAVHCSKPLSLTAPEKLFPRCFSQTDQALCSRPSRWVSWPSSEEQRHLNTSAEASGYRRTYDC